MKIDVKNKNKILQAILKIDKIDYQKLFCSFQRPEGRTCIFKTRNLRVASELEIRVENTTADKSGLHFKLEICYWNHWTLGSLIR